MADSASVISETPNREVKVFAPPSNASSRVDLPESFYKLDANEIKALYSSQVERRQKLENAQVPLKTQKMRNAEEQERMKKYPKTAIRVRLPDSVILQATFQSKERVAELYEFVRSALRAPDRKFLLCLPPRSKLTDPTLTLFKAGLAPASNVIFVWIDKPENGQEDTPILNDNYINIKQPLTVPNSPESSSGNSSGATSSTKAAASSGSKSSGMPKWLQKGLFKK